MGQFHGGEVVGHPHRAHRDRDDAARCLVLSTGEVRELLSLRPCRELDNKVFTTTVDDRVVTVTVSTVRMADDFSAVELAHRLTAPTGGALNDPGELPGVEPLFSEVTARREGSDVVQTRAWFSDGGPSRGAAQLRKAGQAALKLTNR
jgi:hypothetical protein